MRKIVPNFYKQFSRQITAKFLIFLLILSNVQGRVISIFGVEIELPTDFSKLEEHKFISLSESAIVKFLTNLTLPLKHFENYTLVELQDYDAGTGVGPLDGLDGGGGGGDSPILVAVNAIEVPKLDNTLLFQELNALLSPYLGDGGSRELIFGAVQNILAGGFVGFFSRTAGKTRTTIAPSITRTRTRVGAGAASKTTVKPKITRIKMTARTVAIATTTPEPRIQTEKPTLAPTTEATTITTQAPTTTATSTTEGVSFTTKRGGYKINRMKTKNRTNSVTYGFDEYFQ